MNAYTEEKAKTKWCPQARQHNVQGAYNRYDSPYMQLESTACIASDCMMWTWDYANCTDWGAPTEGYCGLRK